MHVHTLLKADIDASKMNSNFVPHLCPLHRAQRRPALVPHEAQWPDQWRRCGSRSTLAPSSCAKRDGSSVCERTVPHP